MSGVCGENKAVGKELRAAEKAARTIRMDQNHPFAADATEHSAPPWISKTMDLATHDE